MMIVRQHIALGETDYYGSRIFSMKILCLVVRDGESHRSEARPFVILMITFVTLDYKCYRGMCGLFYSFTAWREGSCQTLFNNKNSLKRFHF